MMYLTQALHRNVRQSPHAIAAMDANNRLSWSELVDRVARFAAALRRDGLQPGDRVGMLDLNGVDFLIFVMGTLWAGGVINPVNLRWTPGEIAYSLDDCDTRFLIVGPSFRGIVDAVRAETRGPNKFVTLGDGVTDGATSFAEWIAGVDPVDDALRRGSDLAAVLYTGGTTGRPKGVMLSHGNLAASMLGGMAAGEGRATQRYLHAAPLFHLGALGGQLTALSSGSTSLYLPRFNAQELLEAIERWQVTELLLVPTMIRMMLDHPRFSDYDTSSVRRLRYGASSIDAPLLERAIDAFPDVGFIQSYGMTELSPVVTVLSRDDHGPAGRASGRVRTAGRVTLSCEVRIVGPDDQELATGEIGEIIVRGPTVMLGYWNQPDATAAAVRDGWMHTGDLGTFDEDGYLTIVDRLKDMVITGGENVYSAEVESALAEHHEVAQAAVIGVADAIWGERVHAFVVPRPGTQPSPVQLTAHCRQLIAGYKIPRSFSFLDSLPLSAAGKVLKNVLRDQALADALGQDKPTDDLARSGQELGRA